MADQGTNKQAAGGLGGIGLWIVSLVGGDEIIEPWKSFFAISGVFLAVWGFRYWFAGVCDRIIRRKGGTVILTLAGLLAIAAGGYAVWRGICGLLAIERVRQPSNQEGSLAPAVLTPPPAPPADKNPMPVVSPRHSNPLPGTLAHSAPSVDVTCTHGALPSYVPTTGSYRSIFLFHHPDDIQFDGGTTTFPLPPGTILRKDGEESYESAVICTVTNFSADPIFDVKITVMLSVRQAVPSDGKGDGLTVAANGFRSGPVTLKREKKLFIDRLDPGVDRPYVVYLQCPPPDFVEIEFTGEITGRPLGADKTLELNMIPAVSSVQRHTFVSPPVSKSL